MLTTARAVFRQFHAAGIITPVFLREVITFFALRTGESDVQTNCFLSHETNLSYDKPDRFEPVRSIFFPYLLA